MSSTRTTSGHAYDRAGAGSQPVAVRAVRAPGSAATLLDYALLQQPDPVQASGSASLTLVVSNPGGDLVTCSSIVVLLAIGTSARDLTANPDGIVVSAPGGWSAQRAGGVVTLSPDDGAAPIGANGLAFVFSSVAVNDQPGMTVLVIEETAFTASQPSAARVADLPVAKFPAQFALGSLYVTDPADYVVACGGSATLMWTGSAAVEATYTISYEPADDGPAVSVTVGADGPYRSQPLTRANAVTFTLTATYAVPGQDQPLVAVRQAMVSVQTVSLAFAVAPPAVGVNGLVRLEWSAPNAAYCTLEDGTRLPASGVLYLVLPQTRMFTLSACAADGMELEQQQLTVVVDPTIVPTESGWSTTGAAGLAGTPARCAPLPFDPGTPGGAGGDGGDAMLTGTIPPLDRTVRPARVIPITVLAGRGGDGGRGVLCGPFVTDIGMLAIAGGPGGDGGNAVIDVTIDPSVGAPAQYIVSLEAGAAGVGGLCPHEDGSSTRAPSGTAGLAWMRIAEPGRDAPRLEATMTSVAPHARTSYSPAATRLTSAIPQNPSSNTLLTYAALALPDPLGVGESGQITLVVSNLTRQKVTVTSIAVAIPVGTNAKDLVSTADGIQTQVPADWACSASGGMLTFAPQTPDAGVIGGEGLSFVIADLKVNAQVGTANVVITESASSPSQPAQARSATLPVPKFPAQFQVSDLQANPLDVSAGGATTLTWSGTAGAGATYTMNYQPADQGTPVSDAVGNVGPYVSRPLTRSSSVDFTLLVQIPVAGQDQPLTLTRHASVSVETLSASLSVSPPNVGANGLVHLTWTTANAASCTLDPGIGAVPTSGELYVVVPQTRVFTLTAYGNAGGIQQPQKTVTVDPSIQPNISGHQIIGQNGGYGGDGASDFGGAGNGGNGGNGQDAVLTVTLPPLDPSSTPARVMPITLVGGNAGNGGNGGDDQGCDPGPIGPGGNAGSGGNGGNAKLVATFDPAAGPPTQYIIVMTAAHRGAPGQPGDGTRTGNPGGWGSDGVVTMTFDGIP